MKTLVSINGSGDPAANYLSWSPTPCQIRLTDASGATAPVGVTLRNQNTAMGGQVVFSTSANPTPASKLNLALPVDGSPVPFFAAGELGKPSSANKDGAIEVVAQSGGAVLGVTELMVRIRKNANKLSDAERDRFVAAFAKLNNAGTGKFVDFREMHHQKIGLAQAHGADGFLPWHRSYLLDLERELQKIDPSVALPYWRFDEAAPQVFTLDFMGVSDVNGSVHFAGTNQLQFWRSDNQPGVNRTPLFNTQTEAAHDDQGQPVRTQAETLAFGNAFDTFRRMEGDPHNLAHGSFDGFLPRVEIAPRDPLFFLLHANVDRLWAVWQFVNRRFDAGAVGTYTHLGRAGGPGSILKGHNLLDTLWPWDGDTHAPRPKTAPGGPMPAAPPVSAPPARPLLRDMIDYQGKLNAATRLGFDYDDVPFQP
jgi:tyrosinase